MMSREMPTGKVLGAGILMVGLRRLSAMESQNHDILQGRGRKELPDSSHSGWVLCLWPPWSTPRHRCAIFWGSSPGLSVSRRFSHSSMTSLHAGQGSGLCVTSRKPGNRRQQAAGSTKLVVVTMMFFSRVGSTCLRHRGLQQSSRLLRKQTVRNMGGEGGYVLEGHDERFDGSFVSVPHTSSGSDCITASLLLLQVSGDFQVSHKSG